MFSNTYHKDMVLEEEMHNNSFKFLDSHVKVRDNQISISLHNKNTISLLSNNSQRFFRFPHFHSATSESVKVGTIIGMFHRAETFSTDLSSHKLSVNTLILEFLSISYPKSVIKKAITHMFNTSSRILWKQSNFLI